MAERMYQMSWAAAVPEPGQLVVINRGKVLVDKRSLPDGEFYRDLPNLEKRLAEIKAEKEALVEEALRRSDDSEFQKQFAARYQELYREENEWRKIVEDRFRGAYPDESDRVKALYERS